MKKQKKHLALGLVVALLVGLFAAVPSVAPVQAALAGDSYYPNFNVTDDCIISSVQYIESNKRISIEVDLQFAKVKQYEKFELYTIDSTGAFVERNEVAQADLENTGTGYFKYTFKNTYASAATLKIGAYGYETDKKDDSALAANALEVTLPAVTGATVEEDAEAITMTETTDWKTYEGTFVGGVGNKKLYTLKATADAMFSIGGFQTSGDVDSVDGPRIAVYKDKEDALKGNSFEAKWSDDSYFYWTFPKGAPLYVVVSGQTGDTYSFEANFRKYVHAKTTWSIKEGSKTKTYSKNTKLHITCKITNKSDSTFSANIADHNVSDVKLSKDGKTLTFVYNTGGSEGYGGTRTVSVPFVGVEDPMEIQVVVGISASGLPVTTGYNYIQFDNFSPYVNDIELSFGTTTITIYLKQNGKWVKKFSVPFGSKKSKQIKNLKSNTKYQLKVEYNYKSSDGKKLKSSKNMTAKTGMATAPVIKSAKLSNIGTHTYTSEGHWVGSEWFKGSSTTVKTCTLTVTLKSKLKGCKGLYYQGLMSKGSGTTFTFHIEGTPSKVSVCGYGDDTCLALSKYSSSVSTTK